MTRRTIPVYALAALLAAAPAHAQTVVDQIIAQLEAQGFTAFDVSRTLLGRSRIVATSGDQQREIIVNPRTGEILRDYWIILGENGEAVGSALQGDEDDEDDDEDGDSEDDGEGGDDGEDGEGIDDED